MRPLAKAKPSPLEVAVRKVVTVEEMLGAIAHAVRHDEPSDSWREDVLEELADAHRTLRSAVRTLEQSFRAP